jgi:hypothetical protein
VFSHLSDKFTLTTFKFLLLSAFSRQKEIFLKSYQEMLITAISAEKLSHKVIIVSNSRRYGFRDIVTETSQFSFSSSQAIPSGASRLAKASDLSLTFSHPLCRKIYFYEITSNRCDVILRIMRAHLIDLTQFTRHVNIFFYVCPRPCRVFFSLALSVIFPIVLLPRVYCFRLFTRA